MPTKTETHWARIRSIRSKDRFRAIFAVLRGDRFLATIVTVVAFAIGPGLGVFAGDDTETWLSTHFRDHPLVGTVWTGDGKQSSIAELTERAVTADFVLLGEVHPNPDHHRFQARILSAIMDAGRRPALVFEMIPARYQATLDEFAASKPEDAKELGAKVDWEDRGWPEWKIYQPVADLAVSGRLPLIAGDLDRDLMRKVGKEGRSALTDQQLIDLHLVDDLPPAADDQLKETLRISHCDLLPETAIAPMVLVQRARDGAMATAMLDAARNGGEGAVLIAGAGHTRNDFGVPAVIEAQRPGASIVSVSMIAVDPEANRPADYGRLNNHDFILFTPREDITDHCAEMAKVMKSGSRAQ